MKRVLSGLEPKCVFEIFEDIAAIPHGSGNTKAISDYCVRFARERGFSALQDGMNNVIIKKPASAGYEAHEPVVLQGHLDMVCEKEPGLQFDFERQGLNLKIEGDFLSACGTTLGGDDGVAVAMALSILDDNTLKTPPLEIIFTTDEEVGMFGATALDTSSVTAKRFISLDCSKEGYFTAGCAGGVRVTLKLPLETEKAPGKAYKVVVSGLKGGHSGEEIDKGRLNANKLLGAFLSELKNVRISDISGGEKDNAIPVFASCVFTADGDIEASARRFEAENRIPADSELKITVTGQTADAFCTAGSSAAIIGLICALPFGIQAMSRDIEGVVETSLNPGVMSISEGVFYVKINIRSSVLAEKEALKMRVLSIGDDFGAAADVSGDYPAWEYKVNSEFRQKLISVFKEMFGREPQVRVIHAGLECGIFSEKIEGIDAVALGPDMFDIHTSRERFSISSLARTYAYLCKVLEEL